MDTLALASSWLPTDHWSPLVVMALYLPRLLPAIAATFAFALAAWGMRAVTFSGAIAGLIVTLLVTLAAGLPGFGLIFTVFALTFVATRLGYSHKQKLGAAESHEGRRASQVYANLGAATMCAVPLIFVPGVRGLLLGVTAALAEATADTVSSELGQAFSDRPVLITTLERVKPGTDGGISITGTVAGVVAACAVALVAVGTGLIYPHWFFLVVFGATLGMMFDSLLGATFEGPAGLGNDAVNFLSSTLAAFFVLLTWLITQMRG